MPYKLKKVTDATGTSLWNVFNQRIAAKYGIVFKNRVPAVVMFPDQFDKISMTEYNKIYSIGALAQQIASAHSLMNKL